MAQRKTSSAASMRMREVKTKGSSVVKATVLNAQSHFFQAEVGNTAQVVVRVIQPAHATSSSVSRPSRGGLRAITAQIGEDCGERRDHGDRHHHGDGRGDVCGWNMSTQI